MHLDVTVSSGSPPVVQRLTEAAIEHGLAVDVLPQGGRLETRVRLRGETLHRESDLDDLLSPYGADLTLLSRTVTA